MARPAKTGLDYFPLDVGFLRDKKVKLLRTEFGASSVLFVLYVFGKVYEGNGYFLRWDKDEALIAADELRESPQYISEVLQGCLSRSLFDERVFQVFGILTSAGIQRRYLRSCEKRDDISICTEYWLLDVDDKKDVPSGIRAKLAFFEVSGGKNSVNSPGNQVNSPGNQESKVKESKVKESKDITVSKETVCCTDVQRIISAWNSLGISQVSKIVEGTNRYDWLRKRLKDYGIDEILRAIENVRSSDFLMGRSDAKKPFLITFDWFLRPNNFPKVLDGNYSNKKQRRGKSNNIFLDMLREEEGYE